MTQPLDPLDQHHQNFYTGIAGDYHGLRYGSRYGVLFRQLHHEILASLLPSNGRILEVACGTGHTTELLAAQGLDYVACDLTANMLEQARRLLGKDIPLVRANALQLPFPDTSFDFVLSTRFMHLFTVQRQAQVMAEMMRVLKPGGRLVLDFDNFSSRWLLAIPHLAYNLLRYQRLAPDTHYNRITPTEEMLMRLGLAEPRSIGVAGYHLALPALYSRALALGLGRRHRTGLWRLLSEQFVCTGLKRP